MFLSKYAQLVKKNITGAIAIAEIISGTGEIKKSFHKCIFGNNFRSWFGNQ